MTEKRKGREYERDDREREEGREGGVMKRRKERRGWTEDTRQKEKKKKKKKRRARDGVKEGRMVGWGGCSRTVPSFIFNITKEQKGL